MIINYSTVYNSYTTMSPRNENETKLFSADNTFITEFSDDEQDTEYSPEYDDFYETPEFLPKYDIYMDEQPVKKRVVICPKYVSIIGETTTTNERRFVVLKRVINNDTEKVVPKNIVWEAPKIQEPTVAFNTVEVQEKEFEEFKVVSRKKKIPTPPPPPIALTPTPPKTPYPVTNKYTTACNKRDQCKMGKACKFAHSIEQLSPFECKFGAKCKNGVKCSFKHQAETKEQYVKRLGIKF